MSELKLKIGSCCDAGIKKVNEDAMAFYQPDEPYILRSKGIALCVADGVSTAEAGKEASESAVNYFMDEYYRTPESWTVAHSAEKILSTLNLKLFRKSNAFAQHKGFLCTFSALVIKGRNGHFFHVGDSRIYLYRQQKLSALTKDHAVNISGNHTVLSRAVGMDAQLHIDHGSIELHVDDYLMLSTDGIHDFIDEQTLQQLFQTESDPVLLAKKLQKTALQNGSDDNLSVVVAQLESMDDLDCEGHSATMARLPFPPDLLPGMRLDGYRVLKELFSSSRSQLYLVLDEASGRQLAMKTPSMNFDDDHDYIDRFVQEEWVGLRISSEHVVSLARQERQRTALYYLMDYLPGHTLEQWIELHQTPDPPAAIALIKQIASGLCAFHQQEAVHQDLKPGNIMLDDKGHAVIVDFGSVYVAGLAAAATQPNSLMALGTAGYADPNYILGHQPGIAGDVYSLATIAYEIFTGHLPYGDAINDCRSAPEFDRLRYRSATQYNAQVPLWFDRALEKGVQFDLAKRYRTVEDLMKDLTQPNPDFLKEKVSLQKTPGGELFWKLMSGFWFVSLLLVIYLFSQT